MQNKLSQRIIMISVMTIALGFTTAPCISHAQSTPTNDKTLAAKIDQMLSAMFKADEPGAAVIVLRDSKPILRKGYGMANLELGVPIAPEMVFRLASITKQFTAVGHPDVGRSGQSER